MEHLKGENSLVDQAGDFSKDLKLKEAKDIIKKSEEEGKVSDRALEEVNNLVNKKEYKEIHILHLRLDNSLETGTNLLPKRGEVRMICLPSRGRSSKDGRQIILTSLM